jgi:hypothetical protein
MIKSSTQNVLLFFCPYLPIGKYGHKALIKYPKHAKTIINQGFFSLQKFSKKVPNQWVRIGRQILPHY